MSFADEVTRCDEPGFDPFERAPLATLTDVEGVDGVITVPASHVAVADCATEWIKSDAHIDLELVR